MRNIGVVIVNYNDAPNTTNLVMNLLDMKSVKKIAVVDNNSKDDSVMQLRKLESVKVHVIELGVNRGFAEGLNFGCKYINEKVQDPLIVCSNSDIYVPEEEVFKSMAKCIKGDTVCVMPKVKEKEEFHYGWKLTNKYKDLLLNIPLINRLYRDSFIYYEPSHFNTPSSIVDVIYGCFFMIDGKTLASINYFDNNTFLYYEEYILARKLQKIKKLSCVDNLGYVVHQHNATIGNNISNLNKYKIYKRSQIYYEKYYNKSHIITRFFFYLFYSINVIPYKIKAIFKH